MTLNISSVLRMNEVYILIAADSLVHWYLISLLVSPPWSIGTYLSCIIQNSLSLGSLPVCLQLEFRWSLPVLGVHLLEWPLVSTETEVSTAPRPWAVGVRNAVVGQFLVMAGIVVPLSHYCRVRRIVHGSRLVELSFESG